MIDMLIIIGDLVNAVSRGRKMGDQSRRDEQAKPDSEQDKKSNQDKLYSDGEQDAKSGQEKLYFDGERYYTYDEFFGDDEPGEEVQLKQPRRKLRVVVASLLAIALITNILAFWPQVYNVAAIQFLVKSRELSKNEHVQQYKEAVVVVSTGSGNGTGFTVSDDGLIVTNHHVIEERDRLLVSFQEGGGKPAELVLEVPDIDIALVKVEAEHVLGQPLNLQQSWDEGDRVYVIGNPLFFSFIANEGQVIGQLTLAGWEIPVMVIDAPIYKGNSGSPVINEDGEVIGVVFATTKIKVNGKNKKVGLAIPADAVMSYVE